MPNVSANIKNISNSATIIASECFMFIDETNITAEMVNRSTSRTLGEMPKKVVGEVTTRMLTAMLPLHEVYIAQTVYTNVVAKQKMLDELWDGWGPNDD